MTRNQLFLKVTLTLRSLFFQAGKRLTLGNNAYIIRGFVRNVFCSNFTHEPYLLKPLRDAIESTTGAFIDVGANTGQTLIKVLSIKPNMEYIGFEPQVGCCFFIQQFLTDNQLLNTKILPIGLSDKDGTVNFFSSSNYDEMASATNPLRGNSVHSLCRHISVRIGDDILKEIGVKKLAVIKIDVEGGELEVLRGLTKTIERDRPTVFFEVQPNFITQAKISLESKMASENTERATMLFNYFTEKKYTLYQITLNSELVRVFAFDLDNKCNYHGMEYLAKPEQA